jgi:hypothetical protein
VSTFRMSAAIVALLLAVVVPIGAVSAASVEECSAQIDQLRGAVAVASFTNEKDRTTVDAKLVAARQKLAQVKTADSIEKLVDFRTRVQQLGAAGKLGSADASALGAAANRAIACLQSVSSTS